MGVTGMKGLRSRFLRLRAALRIKTVRRNVILTGSLVVILLAVSLWAILSHRDGNQSTDNTNQESVAQIDTAAPMKATVSYREGIVEYSVDSVWSPAGDTELVSGMGLRTTGAASRTVVTLGDGSEVRLDANTEVYFETLTESRVSIEQKSGYVYSRIVPSEDRVYDVRTQNAQFQARGTAFRTSASGDEEAVEVFHGSVAETTTNLNASEGKKLTVESAMHPDKNHQIEQLDVELIKKDSFITWNRDRDRASDLFKTQLGFLSDFDGPTISISEPVDGTQMELEADAAITVRVKGKTEAGAKLSVISKSIAGGQSMEVSVQPDGNFETVDLTGVIGTSVFELTATDRIGNKTVTSVSYTFKRKSAVAQQGIVLQHSIVGTKVKLEWALIGVKTPDGVKVLQSDSKNPTFPDTKGEYVKNGTTTSVNNLPPGTYHFRVCRYIEADTACDIYSNDIEVVIE